MGFALNNYKQKLIDRYGQTYGSPLFDDGRTINLPCWIWSGDGLKAEVYQQMKARFADQHLMYLTALIKLGGSATDAEIAHEIKQMYAADIPNSTISARRNFFVERGIVRSFGKRKLGPKGATNTIWEINYQSLKQYLEEL